MHILHLASNLFNAYFYGDKDRPLRHIKLNKYLTYSTNTNLVQHRHANMPNFSRYDVYYSSA